MAKKLTRKVLIQELRKLLARPDTKILKRRCKTCGHSKWFINSDGSIEQIVIFMDPRRIGHVQLVIHELLHVFMETHLKIGTLLTYDLEEVAIEAWERSIYKTIAHNDKELESWSEAILRKVG